MANYATTQNIKTVIQQYDEFDVAPYQRAYSWTHDEISEFFTDVKDAVESARDHFFGTLILQLDNTNEKRVEIVDGQQRLTTIFIFLAALRDQIENIGLYQIPADSENGMPILIQYKIWRMIYASEDNFKEIRFKSNPILRKLMMETVLPEPKGRTSIPTKDVQMTLAFRKGVKVLRNLLEEDLTKAAADVVPEKIALTKLKRINQLFNTVTEQFRVLQVPTKDRAESLDVFLTLNDRGVPLGPSDLIRTQIMSILGEGESEKNVNKIHQAILDEWKDVVEQVKDPEVFLRHLLVSRQDKKVQKKKIVEFVQKELESSEKGNKRHVARNFWADLIQSAEHYGDLIDGPYGDPKSKEGNSNWAFYLHQLEGLSKSHRIALLPLMERRADFDPEIFNEYFRLVYILQFRWTAGGGNAQKLEDFYQECTNSIRNTNSLNESTQLLRKKIASTDPDVERLLREEGDSNFICRALLHAVNRALVKGAKPILLGKDVHLEHVCPKSMTQDWLEYVFNGNSDLYGDYESIRSQIGNLTLLDEKLNKEAMQKPFEEKRDLYYFKSVFFITKNLDFFNSWDHTTIDLRTKWLTAMFECIWPSDSNPKHVLEFAEWSKLA